MGAGSSVSLKKATSSEEAAGQLFDELDANSDGQLTIVEVHQALESMTHFHAPFSLSSLHAISVLRASAL